MKYLIYIYICTFTLLSCSPSKRVELKVMMNIPNIDNVIVTTPTGLLKVELDEFGLGNTYIELEKPCFVSVFYEGKGFDIFLTPAKDIEIEVSQDNSLINYEVKCDDAGVNEYLIKYSKRRNNIDYISFKLEEKEYIQKTKEYLEKELELAKKLSFPDEFKLINAERIKYDVLYPLSIYPQYHSYETDNIDYLPSQSFIDFVNSYFKEKKNLFGYSAYVSYMDNISVCNANRYIKDWDSRQFTVNVMEFVQASIKNKWLKEILITKRLNHYLTVRGLDRADAFLNVFKKEVKCNYYISEMDSLVKRLEAIERGNKSYPFVFKDVNSTSVSLESLKGKYKYICIWSSWCIPCRKELIAFNALRKKYKNKNIEFVAVSIDQNRNKWKTRLKEDKIGGIQLNYFGDNKFLEAYMVYGIPRYILLDKNGFIINSRELSVTDKEIEGVLNSLPSL